MKAHSRRSLFRKLGGVSASAFLSNSYTRHYYEHFNSPFTPFRPEYLCIELQHKIKQRD